MLSEQELLIGTTDSLAWTRVSLEGAVVGRVALPSRRRAVDQADVEAERRRLSDSVRAYWGAWRLGPPDQASRFMAIATYGIETAAAETFPAFDRATPGTNGVVWVRLYPRPRDAPTRWLALDRDGRALGEVSLPVASSMAAASHDWIVVLERDAYDAPVLRILAIEGGIGPEG